MKNEKILIVEDDREMANKCRKLFTRSGYNAEVSYSGNEALEMLAKDHTVGIVLTDLRMPGMDGIELLKKIRAEKPGIEVIIMTGYGTIQNAVQAIKIGATDYITKPFNKDELLNAVKKIIDARELKTEVAQLRAELGDRYGFENIIGKSKKMVKMLKHAAYAAQSNSSVLILGESGTGKELIARAIHHSSARAKNPFVPVNCGALPKELIESELFGHIKGAYTGADRETLGLFRSAHHGTIFLDEIAEMPNETQVALLRVLQEKRVRPVGDTGEIPIDVRVVSATNRDITEALENSLLRKDLYYRISVVSIEIPPIRERPEDIPLLIGSFIEKFNKIFKREVDGIGHGAVQILMEYRWPGNVRELENFIEGLYVMGVSGKIKAADVEDILRRIEKNTRFADAKKEVSLSSLSDMERQAIERALIAAKGNKSKAAEILGISRTRLYNKMELYGLEPFTLAR